MNWNDYEAAWKRQEPPVGATADVASLKETFETKRRKLAATLLMRDLAESVAGLFVAGVYARVWWQIGKNGWPIALAIALLLGVTAFFVKERVRAHRQRLGPETPILAKLTADIAELQHQRTLLRSIWKWYLAPIAAAMTIFGITLLKVATQTIPPEVLTRLVHHPLIWGLLAATFVGCAACIFLAWRINQRAVQKQIEPRLEELEKLRAGLLS